MKQNLIIYHGSQQIVEVPRLGIGKKYNDYGQGFYCTENNEKSLFANCLRTVCVKRIGMCNPPFYVIFWASSYSNLVVASEGITEMWFLF